MSRRKRLEKLEALARRRRSYVPGKRSPVLLAILESRPFSWMPSPDREVNPVPKWAGTPMYS
jgi:hypothetical protein